jgi:hypothetical protein
MLPTEPATRPESYRQLRAAHAPVPLWKTYWRFVVALNFWSWSMAEIARGLLEKDSAVAGRRKDRVGVRHDDEGAEPAVLDEIDAACEAVDLRVIPGDGKRNRGVEQDAEVVRVGGALDEVAEVQHDPCSLIVTACS